MKKTVLAFACLWTLVVPEVFAQEGGFYLGAQGGVGILEDAESEDPQGTFNITSDPGYTFLGTFGYDLGETYPSLGRGRLELEIGYRQNDLDHLEFSNSSPAAEGDVSVLSFMVNTFGELQELAPFYPYFGGGIGMAQVSLNGVRSDNFSIDDDDTVFAWQAGAGVGVRINPYLVLDLGYRYFSTLDTSFTYTDTGSGEGVDFDSEYTAHTFLFGARYDF